MNLTNQEPMARKIYKVLVPTHHKRIKITFSSMPKGFAQRSSGTVTCLTIPQGIVETISDAISDGSS